MRPACIPCGRFLRPLKNGARVVEHMPRPGVGAAPSGTAHAELWQPYKLWMCDLWRCDGCGSTIAAGFARQPMAEHWQVGFAARLEAESHAMGGALPPIYDC